MSDALRDRVETALGDAYEFEAEIGRGGMGVVYRARDRKLRRHVAIKVLPPELAFREEIKRRFLREAETAAQLNHPNIVPIYAVEEREGLVCFVMALVDGESLGARLTRERRPPIAEARAILLDVADALAYAHHRGIVHRDIKPDNILLDRATGRPMVTDFGIARAMEGDSRLTITGVAVGTPAYMSPEQAMGDRDVDGRSDVYSLAVVGYQMLVGELPFQATNTPSMLMKHLSEPLRPLRQLRPDLPLSLSAVVERALAKKPDDRWPDAVAFREALAAADLAPGGAWLAPDAAAPDRLSAAWKHAARSAPPGAGGTDGVIRNDEGRAAVARRTDVISGPGRSAHIDAVDAANAGRNGEGLAPMPPWMPPSWREARRQWGPGFSRQQYRAMVRAQALGGAPNFGPPTEEERIRRFRRKTASMVMTVTILFLINVTIANGGGPWFLIPAAFLGFGWLRSVSHLWADGISLRRAFSRAPLAKSTPGPLSALPPSPNELALALAPQEVLDGPYGTATRRAAQDRAAAKDALARLSEADRQMIPDVAPTLDALAERVGTIAQSLHRMDEDITPEATRELDRRMDDARRAPESAERDQRLALLERQQATMADLLKRRDTLRTQLESSALMLQNLRLDLLALRSAGVQAAIDDVSSATQEARAVSRDIARALDAAKEIR